MRHIHLAETSYKTNRLMNYICCFYYAEKRPESTKGREVSEKAFCVDSFLTAQPPPCIFKKCTFDAGQETRIRFGLGRGIARLGPQNSVSKNFTGEVKAMSELLSISQIVPFQMSATRT